MAEWIRGAAAGSPIRAAASGEVKIAQPFTVLGGTVAIDHGQGLRTMYSHMSKIAVQPGARVNKGDVIDMWARRDARMGRIFIG